MRFAILVCVKEYKHIHLLPTHVANKIAAGEVVERPASVVKEFMENAFDAQATRVEVSVVGGGTKFISISDNGTGMEREDACLCLEPQATSKISDVNDIEKINTYGFRGEAVPSVAAISRMTIRTCKEGETLGTEIVVEGGTIKSVSDIGFPSGTTFEIRDIFFNVPARRKFLRSFNTEQSHVRNVFTLQALAHPEATMKLTLDGRTVLSLAGNATILERIHDIFGAQYIESLKEVSYESPKVSVKGYIGLPNLSKSDSREQYIFINRRAATAPVIPFALKEAYPPLEGERKPVAILFIEVAPTEVDVNVHPTKREVRFRDARAVRDGVILAIQKALTLGSFKEKEEADFEAAFPLPPLPVRAQEPLSPKCEIPKGTSTTPVYVPQKTKYPPFDANEPRQDFYNPCGSKPYIPLPGAAGAAPSLNLEVRTEKNSSSLWDWCRVLGQISGGYLLLETDGGYAVLDPRGAHERVLFEMMLNVAESKDKISQPLLIPITVTLPPIDAARIEEHLPELIGCGFSIATFGDDSFVIEALPNEIKLPDARNLLLDISKAIEEMGAKKGAGNWKVEAIAKATAMSAVSRMAPLPFKFLSKLVEDLSKTKMPYTTPSGRPTIFFTSTRELDRKFGLVK